MDESTDAWKFPAFYRVSSLFYVLGPLDKRMVAATTWQIPLGLFVKNIIYSK